VRKKTIKTKQQKRNAGASQEALNYYWKEGVTVAESKKAQTHNLHGERIQV